MLDIRKEKAISLLIQGEQITVIAKKVCVSRNAIYDWLKNPEFTEEMDKRRNEIVTQSNAYIVANVQSNLEILRELALNKSDKRTS